MKIPHLRALAMLAAACGLAACASVAPPPLPAALPAGAQSWQAPLPAPRPDAKPNAASNARPAAPGATGAAAQAGDWWAGFDDPLLPALVAAAQAASPTLSAAAARIERARAQRVAAGAAELPALDLQASASRGRQVPRQPSASSSAVGVQAGWEIDLFGALAAGRGAAQARLEAAEAAWHDARIALAAETGAAYTAYRACQAQLGPALADAASREETARLTGLSERAGFSAPADAALARAGAAQARIAAINQQAACDTQLKALVELTALAETELQSRLAPGTGRVPQAPPLPSLGVPAQVLAGRPDLVEAARAVLAAAGDQAQSRARERPQLLISGNLAAASTRSAGLTTSGATWSLGPLVVSFPLFDGGARAADSTAARAAYDDAVAQYQARMRRAVREVESALVALNSAGQRQQDAERAASDFERSLRATESRQRGGLASLFDLENARRNALAAQAALIELERERTAAHIALYRALGGGWSPQDAAPRLAGRP